MSLFRQKIPLDESRREKREFRPRIAFNIIEHQQFQDQFRKETENIEYNDPSDEQPIFRVDSEAVRYQSQIQENGKQTGPSEHPNHPVEKLTQMTSIFNTPKRTQREINLFRKVLEKFKHGSKWLRDIVLWRNVTRFVNNIRHETRLFSYSKLSEFHLNLVNDKASCYRGAKRAEQHLFEMSDPSLNSQQQNPVQRCLKSAKRWMSQALADEPASEASTPSIIPLVRPESWLYFFWSIVVAFVIIENIIRFPIINTFDESVISRNNRLIYLFSWLELAILLFDIILRCNSEMLIKGEIIRSRGLIILHYLNKGFMIDLIGVIAYILQNQRFLFPLREYQINDNVAIVLMELIQYMFLFKSGKVKSVVSKVEKKLRLKGEFMSYWKLIKLLFFIFIMAHYMSCIWYQISEYSLEYYSENWLSRRAQDQHWLVNYLSSTYFILMTMTTVGYGDIVPVNPIETSACLFLMLICSALFGYTLNSINQILYELQMNTETYKKQKQIIVNYMEKRRIDDQLQKRVKNYLKDIFSNGMVDNIEAEQTVLKKLSIALREELEFEDKGKLLMKIPIFKKYFSEKLIRRLSQSVVELYYSPGDIIDSQEDKNLADNALCYIYKGSAEFWTQYDGNFRNQRVKMQDMSEGEWFGLENLLVAEGMHADILSGDFTILYCLSNQTFKDVLSEPEFSEDYETYCMLRDKLTMTLIKDEIVIKCISCGSKSHSIDSCPLVTYVPNRQLIVKKSCYCPKQERSAFPRKFTKTRSLLLRKSLKEAARRYIKSLTKKIYQQQQQNEISFQDEDIDENEVTIVEMIPQQDELTFSNLDQMEENVPLVQEEIEPQGAKKKSYGPAGEIQVDRQWQSRYYFPEMNVEDVIKRVYELQQLQKMHQITQARRIARMFKKF